MLYSIYSYLLLHIHKYVFLVIKSGGGVVGFPLQQSPDLISCFAYAHKNFSTLLTLSGGVIGRIAKATAQSGLLTRRTSNPRGLLYALSYRRSK